jgi:hypothetical protein
MTRYQCSECGAEDFDHQSYTAPPPALTCWKCRAGKGMSVADQVANQLGMLPKRKEQEN